MKGTSGNPRGRPAVPETVRQALQELVPESIDIKRRILRDADAPLDLKNRVADSVLDRVYGKPAAMPEHDDGAAMDRLQRLLGDVSDAAQR